MTEPGEFSKIGIIRLSAVGDVIVALPALEALRSTYPDAHISWIVERRARNIPDGHPAIDEIIEFPRERWIGSRGRWFGRLRAAPEMIRFLRGLRRRRFDATVDFQGNLKSGLCTLACGAPARFGYARSECREPNYLFTNRRLSLDGQAIHRIDRDLLLAGQLGARPTPGLPRVAFEEDDKEPGRLAVPHRWRSCGGDAPRDHRLHAPQEVVSRFVR